MYPMELLVVMETESDFRTCFIESKKCNVSGNVTKLFSFRDEICKKCSRQLAACRYDYFTFDIRHFFLTIFLVLSLLMNSAASREGPRISHLIDLPVALNIQGSSISVFDKRRRSFSLLN